MSSNLIVTSSPHIHGRKTTKSIMLDVVIALVPAAVMAAILFGWGALIRVFIGILGCVLFECLWCLIMKKPDTTGDLSAVVTGILLTFNVPSSLPVWQLLVGCLVAVILVKQLFGGIGYNFLNPALAARVFMGLSFPETMTAHTFPSTAPDSMSTATPLLQLDALSKATPAAAKLVDKYADLWTLFIGNHGGVLGETCAAALIIGFIYLLVRGVINPIIPLSYIGSAYLLHLAFGAVAPLNAILSGGLMLGAIFMASDYTTSPYSNLGKLIFGLGCGLLTVLIRTYSSTSEGVTYAILIMNLIVPYINDLTRRKPYGGAAK